MRAPTEQEINEMILKTGNRKNNPHDSKEYEDLARNCLCASEITTIEDNIIIASIVTGPRIVIKSAFALGMYIANKIRDAQEEENMKEKTMTADQELTEIFKKDIKNG